MAVKPWVLRKGMRLLSEGQTRVESLELECKSRNRSKIENQSLVQNIKQQRNVCIGTSPPY